MGRGVSAGGGQSSLGYLFGSGEAPKPAANNAREAAPQTVANVPASKPAAEPASAPTPTPTPAPTPAPAPAPSDIKKQIPAGVSANTTNNYFRADGQNCGNFLTDRPTTKVHAAPGGGSSLDYLFGGGAGGGANSK